MQLAPGVVVLGRYRIDSVLGTGGMGVVVKAAHIYMAQPVAIKFLKPDMVQDSQIVQRFLREAHATVRLRGDHVARVIDVGMMPDGTPFMVMEYLEGADMNQILRHHGAQAPSLVVDMLLQACEGIAEAHAIGIVHRDLKPSNCFITRKLDGQPLLKILDFGISKAPTGFDSELTKTHAIVGTPAYMAPEQMVNQRSVDQRTDVWALGIVMYQLLTGRLPFQAESYPELCIRVGTHPPAPIGAPLPPGLGEVLLRCLEKEQSQRFQSVAELAAALAPFATDPGNAFGVAERTRRILAAQGQGPTLAVTGGGGGPLTPVHRSGHSSLGGAAGQMMTQSTVGSRGIIIGGTAAIIVGIAGGAYFAMSQNSDEGADEGEPRAAAAPAPADPATTQPDPPTADPGKSGAVATAPSADKPADAGAKPEATKPGTTAVAVAPPADDRAAKKAAAEHAAANKKAAAKKAAADRAAAKRLAAEKKAADKKAAAEKKAADKKADDDKKATDKKPSGEDLFARGTADKKPEDKKPVDKKPADKKPSGGGDDDLFDRR